MADPRPQYQHGVGTIGGQSFHWGSGQPGAYWSIPYGDYPVTPDAPTGDWAHKVGAIPIANNVIPDPQLGRNRIGIMIHSGSASSLDALYTQGCFKVAPSEWPAVRQEILKEASAGPLYLHVQPGGVASFTNTQTMASTTIPTAGAPGPPAVANSSTTRPAGPLAAPASPLAAPATNSPYGNPFLDKLAQIESNNRNIPSTVDKDYPGQPGSKSQGFFQIDTPTWLQFAAANGIDTKQYPNAMSAPPDVQAQVASSIPLSRFGPRTQKMLGQQFGTLDKSATIGALASNVATPTAPGPADPSAVARGSTVNPPVDGSATASAAPAPPLTAPEQSLWGRFTQGPIDPATGKPDPNKPSPMAAIADAIIKSPQTEKAKEEAEAPERSALSQQGPGARNVGPMGGIAATANPQTYGQTLNSFSQPLAWNDAPPQAPTLPAAGLQPTLGGQAPGMTLNSFRLPQGLGYGIDPNLGYGSLGVGYG